MVSVSLVWSAVHADQCLLAKGYLRTLLIGDTEDFELADGQRPPGAYHRADRFEIVALRRSKQIDLKFDGQHRAI